MRTTRQTTKQLLNVNATAATIRKAPKTTKRKAPSVASFPADSSSDASIGHWVLRTARELKNLTAFEPTAFEPMSTQAEKPKLTVKNTGTPNKKKKSRQSSRSEGNRCVKCINTSINSPTFSLDLSG